MGGDRRSGLERARGPRRRTPRWRRSSVRIPSEHPELYGDGRAGERVVDCRRTPRPLLDWPDHDCRDRRAWATSASRSRSPSRTRAARSSAWTSTRARWPRCEPGDCYIEDVPTRELQRDPADLLEPPRDYGDAGARRRDARVRPDAADRQPRARPGPAGRRRAGRSRGCCGAGQLVVLESTIVPGHDARAAAAACSRSRAWPRAATSRSPSRPSASTRAASDFTHPQHAEGRGRPDRGVRAARESTSTA